MGVFQEGHEGMIGESKMVERYKRDFEAEIEEAHRSKKATSGLILSVEEYIEINGRGNSTFTLTDLYGRLSLELRSQNKAIEALQGAWEQEK